MRDGIVRCEDEVSAVEMRYWYSVRISLTWRNWQLMAVWGEGGVHFAIMQI